MSSSSGFGDGSIGKLWTSLRNGSTAVQTVRRIRSTRSKLPTAAQSFHATTSSEPCKRHFYYYCARFDEISGRCEIFDVFAAFNVLWTLLLWSKRCNQRANNPSKDLSVTTSCGGGCKCIYMSLLCVTALALWWTFLLNKMRELRREGVLTTCQAHNRIQSEI